MIRASCRLHSTTMKFVHLLIPDLFLPRDFAAEACAGLSVPALEKMLGRGRSKILEPVPLENLLCVSFGVPCAADAPIAPISAAFDGLGTGCWLRADPVHLDLQRDQLLLSGVKVSSEEAAAMSASLNEHFTGQGMEFFAPHAQRWYVRLHSLPRIRTTPMSQVVGGDVRRFLPTGDDASRWHQVFNEIQMLLHAHPLNEAREARGEPIINSVWFWGGGCDTLPAKPADCGNSRQAAPTVREEATVASWGGGCDSANGSLRSSGEPVGLPLAGASLERNYDFVSSDEVLAGMFATSSGATFSVWPEKWNDALSLTLSRGERGCLSEGRQLLVWTGLRAALLDGNLGAWRAALQDFEHSYARPMWQALSSGSIAILQMDILGKDGMRRIVLTPRDAWAFWRRAGRLAEYSIV
jgi:hypothetical protein